MDKVNEKMPVVNFTVGEEFSNSKKLGNMV